jgi:hypothetical protein
LLLILHRRGGIDLIKEIPVVVHFKPLDRRACELIGVRLALRPAAAPIAGEMPAKMVPSFMSKRQIK